ncbi:hypothetical protein C8Q77DRAFT_501183 [Trametes polyzona]|nr:hypothetical protein C8Q77DRAFT_501183 [Trametes polyzona]
MHPSPAIIRRCNQCNELFENSGKQHGADTGHKWQPGYACAGCGDAFPTKRGCRNHTFRCCSVTRSTYRSNLPPRLQATLATQLPLHPNNSTAAPLSTLPTHSEGNGVQQPPFPMRPRPLEARGIPSLAPGGAAQAISCQGCGNIFPDVFLFNTHMHEQGNAQCAQRYQQEAHVQPDAAYVATDRGPEEGSSHSDVPDGDCPDGTLSTGSENALPPPTVDQPEGADPGGSESPRHNVDASSDDHAHIKGDHTVHGSGSEGLYSLEPQSRSGSPLSLSLDDTIAAVRALSESERGGHERNATSPRYASRRDSFDSTMTLATLSTRPSEPMPYGPDNDQAVTAQSRAVSTDTAAKASLDSPWTHVQLLDTLLPNAESENEVPPPAHSPSGAVPKTQEGTPRAQANIVEQTQDWPAPRTSTAEPRTAYQSWRCRSCAADPCADPVATICGHIFCRDCLIDTLCARGSCPVCWRTLFIRLDVNAF